METLLTPRWSYVLVRGIASIVLGVLALAWPGPTLGALTLMFGAYAFADGVITLVLAARRGPAPHRWLVVVDGGIGIAAGVATLLWPGITLLTLVLLMGIRFLVAGIFQVATAISLRHELDSPFLYGVGGAASVALGIVTFIMPGATAMVLVTFLGIYAVVFGVAMSMLSFRLRRVDHELQHRFT